MQKLIHRALQPMARRLANIFARGAVSLVNAGGKLQTLQLRLLAGEIKDNVEHFEPYGFTSHPLPGAEHFTAFLDGDRTHGITLVVTDRRYRLQALEAGAVAVYDKHGQTVVLKADGIHITSALQVVIDAPTLHCTGDITADGDLTADNVTAVHDVKDQNGAKTMAGMRAVHNAHTHTVPAAGGPVVSYGPSASM